MKHKKLPLLLAAMIFISGMGTGFAAYFSDITGNWALPYIEAIQPFKVFNGYPDGTFGPSRNISRIEFIAIIVNALGKAPEKATPWYIPFVDVALKEGLIAADEYGIPSNTLASNPDVLNAAISREEMANVVLRAYLNTGSKLPENPQFPLSDLDAVSPKYQDAARYAVALGIIGGKPNGTFAPRDAATRAEAAALCYKLLVKTGALSTPPGSVVSTGFSVKDIELGADAGRITEAYGAPSHLAMSKYGFTWNVYPGDYKDYAAIGIKDGKVVALTAFGDAALKSKLINFEMTKSDVTKALGKPVTTMPMAGGGLFALRNDAGTATYAVKSAYVITYFDGTKLGAVQILDKAVAESLDNPFGTLSDAVRVGYERLMMDYTNVFRAYNGLAPNKWDDTVALTARLHSEDMAVRNFFGHATPEPNSTTHGDRLKAQGVSFTLAAENLAAGHTDALTAHMDLLNSPGHRANMLRDTKEIGVGIHFGGSYTVYYTELFLSR